MNEARLREIIREELASFFAATPERPRAEVVPITRELEIRRKAQLDMAAKLGRRQ